MKNDHEKQSETVEFKIVMNAFLNQKQEKYSTSAFSYATTEPERVNLHRLVVLNIYKAPTLKIKPSIHSAIICAFMALCSTLGLHCMYEVQNWWDNYFGHSAAKRLMLSVKVERIPISKVYDRITHHIQQLLDTALLTVFYQITSGNV